MKNDPTKSQFKFLQKIYNIVWIIMGIFSLIVIVVGYLFARPIILEEYCMPKAREEAKKYKEIFAKPPEDLLDEYKNRPEIINKNSQPTRYYVELLRCELSLSKRLYPFLHLED